MRKPIIAGNWKMFKVRDEALQFIYSVSDQAPSQELVDSVICAQFTVLRCLAKDRAKIFALVLKICTIWMKELIPVRYQPRC